MNAELKYGTHKYSFKIPENAEVLKVSEPKKIIEKPVFKKSLNDLLPKKILTNSTIAIVVADKTRLCEYDKYLPWLLEVLNENKVKQENITFFIAYGTHPKQSDEESLACYGNSFIQYSFVHHNSADKSVFTKLGISKKGTPIEIRKDILEKEIIITMGAISHHYFAGYGGGRKLLFPGLASSKAIYHNHSLYLNFEKKILQTACNQGNLNSNPIADDLKEINEYLPKYISIHGMLNSKGEVCNFLFGSNYNDFLIACNEYDNYYKSDINKQFDVVLASCGGYPKDINFIQSHKTIHNAAAFVKNGGILIVLAECIDGIGNNILLDLFKMGGWDVLFEKLKYKYEGNGGTALAMMFKTSRIKIYMITSLQENITDLLGVENISLNEVHQKITFKNNSFAVIPNGSLLIK